jgi:uncharacterized protein (DUF779 family)
MGGWGSGKSWRGRKKRPGTKLLTSSLSGLEVPKLLKLLKENPCCYCKWGVIKLELEGSLIRVEHLQSAEMRTKEIRIASIPCHYGGFRYLACCPFCKRQVKTLYFHKYLFACRHCFRMAYPSQNTTLSVRVAIKKKKVDKRINKDCWNKPKWMRSKTFERLRSQSFRLDEMSQLAGLFSLRNSRELELAISRYPLALFAAEDLMKKYKDRAGLKIQSLIQAH